MKLGNYIFYYWWVLISSFLDNVAVVVPLENWVGVKNMSRHQYSRTQPSSRWCLWTQLPAQQHRRWHPKIVNQAWQENMLKFALEPPQGVAFDTKFRFFKGNLESIYWWFEVIFGTIISKILCLLELYGFFEFLWSFYTFLDAFFGRILNLTTCYWGSCHFFHFNSALEHFRIVLGFTFYLSTFDIKVRHFQFYVWMMGDIWYFWDY